MKIVKTLFCIHIKLLPPVSKLLIGQPDLLRRHLNIHEAII